MTKALAGGQLAATIAKQVPGSVLAKTDSSVEVQPAKLADVSSFLKSDPSLAFDYLTAITAVDYQDYFELVYQLASTVHNHSLLLKTRLYDRKNPALPSVVSVWQGADFQEREIFDLFGIKFEGHPNLKHIVLWEGFKGYPLRKDYLEW